MELRRQVVKTEFRGGAKELWRCRDREVLLEGPAGTGKSFVIGCYIDYLCQTYPGIRVLVLRQTRASLTESWMVTFEQKVLHPYHQCLRRVLRRQNRHDYEYDNKSIIVMGGMDNENRLFSTEFDLIYVNEANELTENNWEKLHRALRNGVLPWQQLVGDCNPDAPTHWLNKRCLSGKTTRLVSRHADNPTITPEYMERLESLTGVRRLRLYLGIWAAAEGQIWECFDTSRHVINGRLIRDVGRSRANYYVESDAGTFNINYFIGVVDWGFRNPACLQIWGIDNDNRAIMTHELYAPNVNPVHLAEIAEALRIRFKVERYICDSAEPDNIDVFNRRMGRHGGAWIAQPTKKRPSDFGPSASLVRERLESNSLFIMADASSRTSNEIDALLKSDKKYVAHSSALSKAGEEIVDVVRHGRSLLFEEKKPMSTIEEIPSFVWKDVGTSGEPKEGPDPRCADHGCDCLRYLCVWMDRSDWRTEEEEKPYETGTYGDLMGHAEVFEESLW